MSPTGATWVEQFARSQCLPGSTRTALRHVGIKASSYAVDGARAADYPCRFNLTEQLAMYQQDFPEAPLVDLDLRYRRTFLYRLRRYDFSVGFQRPQGIV